MSDEQKLRDALREIKAIRDIGVDYQDDCGLWVNDAACERNAMYKVACDALGEKPGLSPRSEQASAATSCQSEGLKPEHEGDSTPATCQCATYCSKAMGVSFHPDVQCQGLPCVVPLSSR